MDSPVWAAGRVSSLRGWIEVPEEHLRTGAEIWAVAAATTGENRGINTWIDTPPTISMNCVPNVQDRGEGVLYPPILIRVDLLVPIIPRGHLVYRMQAIPPVSSNVEIVWEGLVSVD